MGGCLPRHHRRSLVFPRSRIFFFRVKIDPPPGEVKCFVDRSAVGSFSVTNRLRQRLAQMPSRLYDRGLVFCGS